MKDHETQENAAPGGTCAADCSAQTLVPDDAPVMVEWNKYRATHEYANTRNWAQHAEHVDGSLWSAFEHGFRAAQN